MTSRRMTTSRALGAALAAGLIQILSVYLLAPLFRADTGDFSSLLSRSMGGGAPAGSAVMTGILILLIMSLIWGVLFYAVFPLLAPAGWLVAGALYGFAVWAVGNWLILPLVGISPFAATENIWLPIVAHLIFGAILGWLGERYTIVSGEERG